MIDKIGSICRKVVEIVAAKYRIILSTVCTNYYQDSNVEPKTR